MTSENEVNSLTSWEDVSSQQDELLNPLIKKIQDEEVSKYRKVNTMVEIWDAIQEKKHTVEIAKAIIEQYKLDGEMFNTLMQTKIGMKDLWKNISFVQEAIDECQQNIDTIDIVEDEVSAIKAKRFNQQQLASLMKTHAELLAKAKSLSDYNAKPVVPVPTPASLMQINIGEGKPVSTLTSYSRRDPFKGSDLTPTNNNENINYK